MRELNNIEFQNKILIEYGKLNTGEDTKNLTNLSILNEIRNLNSKKDRSTTALFLDFLYVSLIHSWDSKYPVLEKIYLDNKEIKNLIFKMYGLDSWESLICLFEVLSKKYSESITVFIVCLYIYDKIDISIKTNAIPKKDYIYITDFISGKIYSIMFF